MVTSEMLVLRILSNVIRNRISVHPVIIEFEKRLHIKEDSALLQGKEIDSAKPGRIVHTWEVLFKKGWSDEFSLHNFKGVQSRTRGWPKQSNIHGDFQQVAGERIKSDILEAGLMISTKFESKLESKWNLASKITTKFWKEFSSGRGYPPKEIRERMLGRVYISNRFSGICWHLVAA